MDFAFSESRKATVSATESAEVSAFSDVLAYIFSRCCTVNFALICVDINPGDTTFDLTDFIPHSRAMFFEKASNAPLLAAYIERPLYPVCALTEDM